MKCIVVAGGGRHVGKTTLAQKLGDLLQGAVVVKLGTHPPQAGKPPFLFPHGTPYSEVVARTGTPPFLVLESGGVLDDPDCRPDLVIFLPTPDGRLDKPGSDRRRAVAHIVRGEPISPEQVRALTRSLELTDEQFSQLLDAVNGR